MRLSGAAVYDTDRTIFFQKYHTILVLYLQACYEAKSIHKKKYITYISIQIMVK